jgi:hypothetical protein
MTGLRISEPGTRESSSSPPHPIRAGKIPRQDFDHVLLKGFERGWARRRTAYLKQERCRDRAETESRHIQ